MHQSNDSILAYISELSERRSRKEGVGVLQGRLKSIYLGDDVHEDSLEYLSELQVDLCSLMRSIGDGNSSVYDDDANGFVHFDSDGETCFKRRGSKLRQISVNVAGRAGFEPTSPAGLMTAYLSALGKAARTALTSGRSSEVDELLRLVAHIGRDE